MVWLALTIGGALATPGGPAWRPIAHFAGPGAIGSPGGTHPIAVDGRTVHVVWAEGGRILYRRSADGGVTWGHAQPLTERATALYPCSLERDGKTLHLFWPDQRHGTWEIYYRRSQDAGDTWGPEACLTPGVDQFRLGTAISGRTLHLVWGSRRLVVPTKGGTHTWGEIYCRRSDDGGATWQPIVRLTQPDGSAMRPSVSASGSYVHVAWFDNRDSTRGWDWEVYTKRSIDGGRTWGPDVRMSRTPTHTRHPEIHASPGGVVCCLWEDGQVFDGVGKWGGDPALYASVSTDNGQTWGKPRRLTHVNEPNGWATHIKSCSNGSRIFVAWTDAPDGQDRPHAAYYMASTDGGRTWAEPERLTTVHDGSVGIDAVGGSNSCVMALIGRGDELLYRRRDIAAAESARSGAARGGTGAMRIGAWGRGTGRFVTERAHAQNTARQVAGTPRVIELLREQGVTDQSKLKLEYFFYGRLLANATALAEELKHRGYTVEVGPSAGGRGLTVVTGWTALMPMGEPTVVAWVRDMCRLGYEHDCEFDGWGTAPEQ